MKLLQNINALLFGAVVASLLNIACTPKRGDTVKHEGGKVIAKSYVPDSRGTSTGFGVSSNGDAVVTSHSYGDPEKFAVVFKCEHGSIFTIDRADLFAKVETGDSVVIDFYELFRKDKVVDYDFVDANRKANW